MNGNRSLTYKITKQETKAIELILQKISRRFQFMRSFICDVLLYLLSFLDIDPQVLADHKNLIIKNINHLMLRRKTNLLGISWYLTQIVHFNGLLSKSTALINAIKSARLSDKIDVPMLRKQLRRTYPPEKWPPFEDTPDDIEFQESFFSNDFQVIIPEYSDISQCTRFLEEFKVKEPSSFLRLLKGVKRFSKLFTVSHTKKLYYPVYLLHVLEEWISRHFGLIEIEFQINIIRMIVGNLEDNKVLNHILLLEYFSPAEKENNFLQLFINSCTIDIGPAVSSKKSTEPTS